MAHSNGGTPARRAVSRWNAGDLDGYLDLYDDRIKLHGDSVEPMGKAAVVKHYRTVWAALAADGSANPHLDIKDVLSNGDRLACRFRNVRHTSRSIYGRSHYRAITLIRFLGPRVIERWSVTDAVKQFTQIGASSPAGSRKE